MDTSNDYRDKFYNRYYTDQAGRGEVGLWDKLHSDQQSYKNVILPYLPADRETRILDLGCGYGSLLHFLSEQGYNRIEGIDISAEQVEQARRIGVTNVQQANLFNFLSKEQSWDVIIALDLIEHFTKSEVVELIELLRTSLGEGGRLIARTPNMDAPFGATYGYGDFTHGTLLNGSSALQLFRSMDFSEVKVYPEPWSIRDGFRGGVRKWGYRIVYACSKFIFFVQGRSMSEVLLTPNMIICADR